MKEPLSPDQFLAFRTVMDKRRLELGIGKTEVYRRCKTSLRFLSNCVYIPIKERRARVFARRMGVPWSQISNFGIKPNDLNSKLELYRIQKAGGRPAYTLTVLEIVSHFAYYLYLHGYRPYMTYQADESARLTIASIQIKDNRDNHFFLEFIEGDELEVSIRGHTPKGPVSHILMPVSEKVFDIVHKTVYPHGKTEVGNFDDCPPPFEETTQNIHEPITN